MAAWAGAVGLGLRQKWITNEAKIRWKRTTRLGQNGIQQLQSGENSRCTGKNIFQIGDELQVGCGNCQCLDYHSHMEAWRVWARLPHLGNHFPALWGLIALYGDQRLVPMGTDGDFRWVIRFMTNRFEFGIALVLDMYWGVSVYVKMSGLGYRNARKRNGSQCKVPERKKKCVCHIVRLSSLDLILFYDFFFLR